MQLSPPGIMYRLCVAVQLHPQFVTKVDRTFCARCFYTEGVNELTRDLEVRLAFFTSPKHSNQHVYSPQGSTEVPVSFDAPLCTYTIRKDSPTGPEIRYATVGEAVYHVWHCPSGVFQFLKSHSKQFKSRAQRYARAKLLCGRRSRQPNSHHRSEWVKINC